MASWKGSDGHNGAFAQLWRNRHPLMSSRALTDMHGCSGGQAGAGFG